MFMNLYNKIIVATMYNFSLFVIKINFKMFGRNKWFYPENVLPVYMFSKTKNIHNGNKIIIKMTISI